MKPLQNQFIAPAIFAVLIFSVNALAQSTKYDDDRKKLSGAWLFEKRTFGSRQTYSSTTGADLIIQIKDVTVRLEYHWANGQVGFLTLNADKKGETNKIRIGDSEIPIVSTTRWEKDSLVRRYMMDCNGCVRKQWVRVVETYSVSNDGNTLTIVEERPSSIAELTRQVGPDSVDVTTRKYRRRP